MTRRAIISDVHGNLEALTEVLRDIESQKVDEIFCLGDIVGYGPNPRECIDICRQFDMVLLGNHDNGALLDPDGFSSTAERAVFWTRQQLEDRDDPEARSRWMFLASLPRTHRVDEYMFVHGSPRSPLNEYVFPEDTFNPRKIERIFGFIRQYCFQGHTHVPGIFTEDYRFLRPTQIDGQFPLGNSKVMVNVGSVGQPRDNDPRSCYVIIEDDSVEFRRVEYPVEVTRQKILAISELDDFLGDRLLIGQ